MVMSGEGNEEQSVLHIWNTAGVSSILAKYQKRLFGWNSWVVMRKKFDLFGLTTYGDAFDCGTILFYIKAILKSINYDLIHIHSLDKMVKFSKIIFPRKKVVLHYHGTDIRGKWDEKRKYWKLADMIIVSTPDILEGAPEGTIYLSNPVDTDLFKPIPSLRKKNTALFVLIRKPSSEGNLEWAEKTAKDMDLELTILDRDNAPVPYEELPEYLNKFEYFIDRKKILSLSKTALEALACGLKVIRWDDKVVDSLPEEHRQENVVKHLKEIYMQVVQ